MSSQLCSLFESARFVFVAFYCDGRSAESTKMTVATVTFDGVDTAVLRACMELAGMRIGWYGKPRDCTMGVALDDLDAFLHAQGFNLVDCKCDGKLGNVVYHRAFGGGRFIPVAHVLDVQDVFGEADVSDEADEADASSSEEFEMAGRGI